MRKTVFILMVVLTILEILARTAQAGANVWTPIGPDGGRIHFLTVDPKNPDTLYAGTLGGGFKGTNGGVGWKALSEQTPIFAIDLVVDPQQPNTLYASVSPGILKSVDGGATWNSANSGLPKTAIRTGRTRSITLAPDLN